MKENRVSQEKRDIAETELSGALTLSFYRTTLNLLCKELWNTAWIDAAIVGVARESVTRMPSCLTRFVVFSCVMTAGTVSGGTLTRGHHLLHCTPSLGGFSSYPRYLLHQDYDQTRTLEVK
ncbi:hypothetical protein E2C01_072917 [Portunus trituberculatus]|uniref:Uncharacterized protein n=1 Tax=Portunus trituberculatus TaxID=210409 RepID=A0A5B7HZC5_PORTR|nr:hypothetical protein [Portunus trituberculatus]